MPLLYGRERWADVVRRSLVLRRYGPRACPGNQRVTGDKRQNLFTLQDPVEMTRGEAIVLPGERFGSRSVPLFDGVHNAAVLVLSNDQHGWQVDQSRLGEEQTAGLGKRQR